MQSDRIYWQTDEKDMGISYAAIDNYILTGKGTPEEIEKIEAAHRKSLHKLNPSAKYGG